MHNKNLIDFLIGFVQRGVELMKEEKLKNHINAISTFSRATEKYQLGMIQAFIWPSTIWMEMLNHLLF